MSAGPQNISKRINSVVRNDSMARKKTHLLRTGNSTTETEKRKDISCYMLETVQLKLIKKKTTAATYWKQYN